MDTGMSYRRFGAMGVTSLGVMYGLMYLNTFRAAHIEYSQTRLWMAVMMTAAMSLLMLGFMWSMYRNRTLNIAIIIAAILVFCGALALVRSQRTVNDVSYMEAMIPHHSIAILTSTRARIRDPRVRQLADSILEAQAREIAEMQILVDDLKRHPTPADAPLLAAATPGQAFSE